MDEVKQFAYQKPIDLMEMKGQKHGRKEFEIPLVHKIPFLLITFRPIAFAPRFV
jgi:hypothetical protein